ncbi:MAG: RHS repeat-associated core domain-containing protein, partial [Nitrospinae bacterium]|nr:RHS repeat-associated core domain-containing protein [Nitrospinota bacterium]
RARYYDPQTGRFLSEDPIGFGGLDQNLYRYVFNNPVNLSDPSGKYASFVKDFLNWLLKKLLSQPGKKGTDIDPMNPDSESGDIERDDDGDGNPNWDDDGDGTPNWRDPDSPSCKVNCNKDNGDNDNDDNDGNPDPDNPSC